MPLIEWQMTFEATSFNAELNKFQLGSWKEEAKSVEFLQRPMAEVDISGGGLRVEAYTCNGFCATFTSCGECAASAECGWCDDGGGGAAGGSEGGGLGGWKKKRGSSSAPPHESHGASRVPERQRRSTPQ